MEKYLEIISNSYSGYWNYLKTEILSITYWDNYFYGLIIISLTVWILEIAFPWREEQAIFRKDFWLDTFYMFFNFFLLNLIVFIALSNTVAEFFNDILELAGLSLYNFQLFEINALPKPLGLFIFFIVAYFVQCNTHMLFHRVPFLFNFLKVHRSVKYMGFAAHFRYHWMDSVVYKFNLYIPLSIIGGFEAQDMPFFHFFIITIGHLNHANLGWDY